MPITITRLEPGIYRSALSDTVQLDELLEAQERGATLAAENGDSRYVLIIDIDRGVTMPFDIRQAEKVIAQNQAVAVLSVGASLHIRLLTSLLGSLFGLRGVEHFNNLEAARARAKQHLKAS